jgi:hypothetical protein
MYQGISRIFTFAKVADLYIIGYDTGDIDIIDQDNLGLVQSVYLKPRKNSIHSRNLVSTTIASDDVIFFSAYNSKYALTGKAKGRVFTRVKFSDFMLPMNAIFSNKGESLIATSYGEYYRNSTEKPLDYIPQHWDSEDIYCESIQKQFSKTNRMFPQGLYLQLRSGETAAHKDVGIYRYQMGEGSDHLTMVMPGVHIFSFSRQGYIATINQTTRLAQVRNGQGQIILDYQLPAQKLLFPMPNVTWLSDTQVMFDFQINPGENRWFTRLQIQRLLLFKVIPQTESTLQYVFKTHQIWFT